MDSKTILSTAKDHMHKAAEFVIHEFAGVRTGKASPQLVEGININVTIYGGTSMKLKQLASISTPDARTIYVQPHDPSTLQDLERGIRETNMGLNPVADGKRLRIPIPELSEERRREMVKLVKTMAEEGKVRVRTARREANESAKKSQKDGQLTEDDLKRLEKEIQAATDAATKDIDEHAAKKEKELLTV
ncbi:MAG: ribosome recycling factor [Verrucomicrobiales bacterium]